MTKKIQTKIESTAQNWDNGTLGASEEHALPSSTGEHALDQAMAMQSISIRLEKTLIDELKMIADINGLGYQPLIRRVLHRFTNSEIKKLVRENAGLIKKQNKSKLFDDDDLECA
jgi:predicted DNA binding CopG/RHH family protein